MKLIKFPEPFYNESLFGYLLRISNNNHYPNTDYILKISGIPSGMILYTPSTANLDKLSSLTGVNVKTLWSMTPYHYLHNPEQKQSDFDSYLLRYGINTHSIKICPRCFENSIYYRAEWDINILTVCLVHQCLLVNRCTNCLSKILQRRKLLNYCDCGFDLRKLTYRKVTSEEMELPILLEDKFKKIGKSRSIKTYNNKDMPLFGLSISELLYLIMSMVRMLAYFENKERKSSFHTDTFDESFIKIITDCVTIFKSWPHNFYEFLDNYSEEKRYNLTTGIKSNFGSFHKVFYVDNKTDSFDFIREAFSNYIHNEWSKGHHTKIKIMNINLKNRKFISGRETSKLLKTPWNKVKKLIEVGELEGNIQIINVAARS